MPLPGRMLLKYMGKQSAYSKSHRQGISIHREVANELCKSVTQAKSERFGFKENFLSLGLFQHVPEGIMIVCVFICFCVYVCVFSDS